MTVSINVTVIGDDAFRRKLDKLQPKKQREILVKSLRECADLVLEEAKWNQIIRGSRFFSEGPRGGRVMKDAPVDPYRLTSRSNTLRDSITVNQSPLPAAIEVGTDKVYGRIHELGLGRYPKRAFLEPAVKAVERRFPEIFMKHWRREAGV